MKEITELNEIKKIELDILDYVTEICDNNEIKYFLGGGTLLGAIRHKGFIPWDDDIDIMLPRMDYEKLMALLINNDTKYKLLEYKHSDNYYYPFAKVVDSETKLIEKFAFKNDEMGIYIDIFPIDFLPDNEVEVHKLFKRKLMLDRLIGAVNFKQMKCDSFKNIIKKILYLFLYPIVKIKKVNMNLLNKINGLSLNVNKGSQVACIMGRYAEKEIMPSNFIDEAISVDFEGKKYKAPKNYDDYLKKHYGDYMTLPPKNKQISEHDYVAYWKEKE